MVVTIGELNRRIEVLEFVESRDDFGGVEQEWIVKGIVWAKIVPKTGTEQFENEQVKSEQKVKFFMRFFASMNEKNRIRYDNNLYEVISVADKNTAHRFTEVMTRLLN